MHAYRGKKQQVQMHWRDRIKMLWIYCPGWMFCGSTWGSLGLPPWFPWGRPVVVDPCYQAEPVQQDLGMLRGPQGLPAGGHQPPWCARGHQGTCQANGVYVGREPACGTALLEWICEGQTAEFRSSHAFGSGCCPGAAACPVVG